ncbi:MAG: flagellar biosynthesis anti-sigma factor FlgM [Bryobacterales bacterium]|nr:flagellar biosynthesis anti-sigma factor FlgM [Bryobacterales bacterium]
MQIHDWLIRPGATPREIAPAPLRVHELLPAESIRIGPPTAEDKLEISALAQMLLEASDRLAEADEGRIERLRAGYLQGAWTPDPDRLALRLVESMARTEIGAGDSQTVGSGR